MNKTFDNNWRDRFDAMQGKIADKLKKDWHVIYSAYKEDENDLPIDNLDEVYVTKPARFISGDGMYTSPIVKNPTWLEICLLANDMIIATQDFHHVYLEDLLLVNREDGIHTYEFVMGS